MDQMEEAADARDAAARRVLAVLEPVEDAAAASACGEGTLASDDQAHYSPSPVEPSSTSIS
ncbi:hypothetical protein [Streptomyces sp. C8S0]|uniref:hypothetical protein n=1 Tax=Streptomyces sp. C8S0 TaxID=2585716 RepID=UPI0039AF7ED5